MVFRTDEQIEADKKKVLVYEAIALMERIINSYIKGKINKDQMVVYILETANKMKKW